MSKRAYLVLGPESSGTRLMARLLMAAGCEGDGDHQQRWDTEQPDADLIVLRRHYPANRPPAWATQDNIILALQEIGYAVTVVIISRDWHCTIESQIAAPHAKDRAESLDKIRACWRDIFHHLPADVPFEIVSYESLVQQSGAVALLYARLGLPMPTSLEPLRDGNAKYYEAVTA